MNLLLLSLISTIVFGIIDSGFFLIFEETIQDKIKRIGHVSLIIAELITGAVASTFAVFVSSKIDLDIKEKTYLLSHPLLDVSGVVIGTIIVVLTYLFYIKFLKCVVFKHLCK